MKIVYTPSKDELLLELLPRKGTPHKDTGPFKLWWDKEGNICAIAIARYTEQLAEFRKNLNVIRLGGIWKGVKITDEDIRATREALLRRLEEKW